MVDSARPSIIITPYRRHTGDSKAPKPSAKPSPTRYPLSLKICCGDSSLDLDAIQK